MIQKRNLRVAGSALCACLVIYFIYHTVQGDRGVLSMMRLQQEVAVAKDTLGQLQDEHKALSHREEMMRPGSIDPDLLDEEARKTLNYSKPNEIIILTPPKKDASQDD
jgi:cell division protein FtsB